MAISSLFTFWLKLREIEPFEVRKKSKVVSFCQKGGQVRYVDCTSN